MPAPRFPGFPEGGPTWFDQLAAHMDKAWYDAHKAEYRRLWHDPLTDLLADLRARLQPLYDAPISEPHVHRIHNDQRFHARAPYKTHIGGWLGVGEDGEGLTSGTVALHVSFGTEQHVGAGIPSFDKEATQRWRDAVVDDRTGGELAALLDRLAAAGFRHHAFQALKKGPPGLTDHPRVELLKLKGLLVSTDPPGPDRMHGPGLADDLAAAGEAMAPVVRWLATHVTG